MKTIVVLPVLAIAAMATANPLCNTGVTDVGGTCGSALVPVGTADPHWQLATPFPSLPSGPALTAAQLATLTFGPVFANTNDPAWMSNGPSSEWLTPSATAGHPELGGQYVYRTTFTGAGGITGRYSSDNELIEVFLNGALVSGFPLNGAADFNIWTNFTITSGLNVGTNTLDFVVRNRGVGGIDTNTTATGFRAELAVPQLALTCTVTSVPTAIRADGESEKVADITAQCTGGTPTPQGQAVPQVNINITFNDNVTSRLLTQGWSEALLLFDDPIPGAQRACATDNGICPIAGTGSGVGTYDGSQGRPNIFQAQQTSANTLTWAAVPLDPPGPSGGRKLRFTNIKVNALAMGPGQTVAFVSSSQIQINNPQQTVAFPQSGLSVSTKAAQSGPNGLAQFTLSFTENFADVLKTRSSAAFVDANTSPAPSAQNTPGAIPPGVETGFYNPALPTTPRGALSVSGLADNGTRVIARISNVPSSVTLSAPVTANLMQGTTITGLVRLVSTDANGSGPFSPMGSLAGTVPLPNSNGTVTLVYEVLKSASTGVESADIPLTLSYAMGAPAVQSLSGQGGLGPLSAVGTADLTAPEPRFNNLMGFTATAPPPTMTAGLRIIGTCPITDFTPGTFVGIPLSASGGSGFYRWTIISTGGFTLSSATGPTTSVQGVAGQTSSSFTVTLTDAAAQGGGAAPAPATFSCAITLAVPPLAIGGSCPATRFAPGTPISIPLTASGGSGIYNWTIASTGASLVLSSSSRTLTLVQGTTGNTSSTFTVTLSDVGTQTFAATPPVTFTCTIEVVVPALAIGGTCPTGAIAAGMSISITLFGQGGSGSYTWQISPGSSGLSLSSGSGASTVIQGTAGSPGQYSFSVMVSDAAIRGSSTTFNCTITVVVPLQITGMCPTQAIVTGSAFSLPLSVSGGSGTYTWTTTGLFSASSTTGSSITLSGTPTSPGSFTVTATVQDNSGSPPATFSCTIRVVAPLTVNGPACPITNLIQGRTFSLPLTGTGGTGSYGWSVSGPSFLSLTSATGVSTSVTGIATGAGSFPFTVTLRDDANASLTASFSCSLQVTAALALQSINLPNGVLDQAYPATTLTVMGGTPPLTLSVSGGNLPPGLQLALAGTLSGTPSQLGTFSFTVTVTDAGTDGAQQSATADFQIQVVPPLMNTTSCPLPAGRELQPYSAALTATGGTGQYTFSLAGSSPLPPGLALNQNAIAGTPQGPSDTVLSIQVSSGTQATAFSCELVILQPTVTVTGLVSSSGTPLLTPSISLDAPVQQDVTGTAVLSFKPDVPSPAITDNPQVQFCSGNPSDPLCGLAQRDASGLLRILPFTIPAGMQSINLSPLLKSNVAGTILISLNNLSIGGQTLTAAMLAVTIPRTPPEFLSDAQISISGQTLQVVTKVSSSTCELSSATTVFTAAQGSALNNASGGTLTSVDDLSSLFQNYKPFAVDGTHPIGGCAFTLTLPFTIAGDPRAIARVDVTLKNAVGISPTATTILRQ